METIPTEVVSILQKAATSYSQSPATTNAGRWLRFLAKIIPPEMVVKIFAHQLKK